MSGAYHLLICYTFLYILGLVITCIFALNLTILKLDLLVQMNDILYIVTK